MVGTPLALTNIRLKHTVTPTTPGVPPERIGTVDPPTKTLNLAAGGPLGGFVKAVAAVSVSEGTALGLLAVNIAGLGLAITLSTKKIGHKFEPVVVVEVLVLIGG